jgi:hypothetical protein
VGYEKRIKGRGELSNLQMVLLKEWGYFDGGEGVNGGQTEDFVLLDGLFVL